MENINRRTFLKTSGIGTAGLALLPFAATSAETTGRQIHEIGLQVYTIRRALARDWQATLRQVAQIGYNTLEMGDYYGDSLASFKQFLQEIGLTVLSGGANIAKLENDLPAVIEKSLALDKKYIMCSWPWSDSPEGKTVDDWKKLAATLSKIGEQVKSAGLTFAYHNHDLEFKPVDGTIPFDILLDNSDPALLFFEMDLYWILKGGANPIDYFNKYPKRFPLWHVKDMDGTEKRGFACLGQGIINFPELFTYAEKADLKHIFVEQDEPQDEMECIRICHDYLRNMRY